MKNIHLLPTEKYSDLVHSTSKYGGLFLSRWYSPMKEMGDSYQNIYITYEEEIKEGIDQWYLDKFLNKPRNSGGAQYVEKQSVIILTTDRDLIADGVQSVDEHFLAWFIKNPSCEYVKINCVYAYNLTQETPERLLYKIIIPQGEPNFLEVTVKAFEKSMDLTLESEPETLEDAAENFANSKEWINGGASNWVQVSFKRGAKWQAERIPSIIEQYLETAFISKEQGYMNPKKWFEQNKKK